MPSSRHLPNPGIEPMSLTSPALAGGFFSTSTTRDAQLYALVAVQPLRHAQLFMTPWTAACQAALSVTVS